MKQRNLHRALMAIAVMLCSWLPSLAQEFEVDYLRYNILSAEEKTVEVDGLVDENIENVVIPSEAYYDGVNYSVVAIGYEAFYECASLKSVDIPDSVETIEHNAFCWCESLETVTIGKSLKSIGGCVFGGNNNLTSIKVSEDNPNFDSRGGCNAIIETATNTLVAGCCATVIPEDVQHIGYTAFYYIESLTSIDIPESVETIGESAFRECEKLEEVTLGNSLKTIGVGAFRYCISLTSIDIPDSVETIGNNTFYGCEKLEEVTLGNSLKTISYGAFCYCSSLTSIDIPDSVETIGESAFYNCSSLPLIDIPDSVETIGEYAFDGCEKLEEVTLGNSLKTIGVCAFYGCKSLTSVKIPDSVKTIGYYTFYGCSALKSVEIGASVESIGDEAFWECYELTEVYSRATTPPVCTGIFEQETVMGTLYVPTGYKSVYAATFPWNAFWTIKELDSLGVEGVAADEVEVKAVGGSIVFDSATEASIYSSEGILEASGVMTEVELPAGLYIVVAGDKSHKVIVK